MIGEYASYETCAVCQWTPDGHQPDDWQAFVPWRTHLLCWDCYTFALHELTTLMHVMDESDDEYESDADASPLADTIIVVNVNNNGEVISVEHQARLNTSDANAVIDLTGLSDSEGDNSVATQ
jgi:hypothetical protein